MLEEAEFYNITSLIKLVKDKIRERDCKVSQVGASLSFTAFLWVEAGLCLGAGSWARKCHSGKVAISSGGGCCAFSSVICSLTEAMVLPQKKCGLENLRYGAVTAALGTSPGGL